MSLFFLLKGEPSNVFITRPTTKKEKRTQLIKWRIELEIIKKEIYFSMGA